MSKVLPLLLKACDAAKILGVSSHTIQSLIKKKRLRAVRCRPLASAGEADPAAPRFRVATSDVINLINDLYDGDKYLIGQAKRRATTLAKRTAPSNYVEYGALDNDPTLEEYCKEKGVLSADHYSRFPGGLGAIKQTSDR